ncbi:AAA family ATPase [Methylocella silvestris]|nr:AAA family ATPase [Methylocella silvestris]
MSAGSKIRPELIGKIPGKRNADGAWSGFHGWQTHSTTDADLFEWAAWGAGVGLMTGLVSGVIAVDIDTLDHGLSARASELMRKMLGPARPRVGRAPKALFLYRCSLPVPFLKVKFDGLDGKRELVELSTDRRQIVMRATHPKTGKPYSWPEGIPPFKELTEVTPEQVEAFFLELSHIMPNAEFRGRKLSAGSGSGGDQTKFTGPAEAVARAVRSLPNTEALYPTREAWLDVLYSIKAALPDDPGAAEALAIEWSDKYDGEPADPDDVIANLARCVPPFRRGASWLYEQAELHAPKDFDRVSVYFDEIDEDKDAAIKSLSLTTGADRDVLRGALEGFDVKTKVVPAGPTGAIKFRAVLGKDAAPVINGNWTIKKILPRVGLGVQYGAPGSGKTFSAMDLALHVSAPAKLSWRDHRVKTGGVAYIACEGGSLTQNRVAAWRDKHGDPGNFALYPYTPDLSNATSSDVAKICQDIKDQQGEVVLVAIDTLAKAIKGADENSGVDMGKFIDACERIRTTLNCFALIVHHSGKDAGKGSRGHSSLLGAIDLEMEVTRATGQDGVHTMKITKLRDGEAGAVFGFRLKTITVGMDEDSDKVTTCLVEPVEVSSHKVKPRRGQENDRRERVLLALNENPSQTQRMLAAELGMDRRAVAAALETLSAERLIREPTNCRARSLTPAGLACVKSIIATNSDVISDDQNSE